MRMRVECREAKSKLDTANAKSDMTRQLLEQLKNEKDSDLGNRLVELSKTLQSIRLNEYQA